MKKIQNDKNDLLFSDNAKFITRNNQIVATNKLHGGWMRFSEECYHYLLQAVNEEMSQQEFVDCFEENDDKLYMKKLIHNLEKIKVIVNQKIKEEEKYKSLEVVDIMLTNRCNLSCKHCATNAIITKDKDYLDTEDVKNIIDKIMICKPKTIILTGGEPLIRKDFLEIIQYIKSKGKVELSVMTNGTLITPPIALEMARYIDSIDISLDGFDEESCSYVRGKGVYHVVLKSIELLQQSGLQKISLSMVSLHHNQLEEKNDLCKKLNITPIIRRLSLKGRAKENDKYLDIENVKEEQYNTETPSIGQLRDVMKACACKAGITMLSIDEKGDLYPCSTFSEEMDCIGNILEINDINEFLNLKGVQLCDSMKAFNQYIPYEELLCKNCDVRYFCWTCPFAAVDVIKNKNELSVYCEGRKAFLYDMVWGENIHE